MKLSSSRGHRQINRQFQYNFICIATGKVYGAMETVRTDLSSTLMLVLWRFLGEESHGAENRKMNRN